MSYITGLETRHHHITVENGRITHDADDDIIQNDICTDDLSIDFVDDEWQDCQAIIVTFENGDKVYQLLNPGVNLMIPWEVLQDDGYLYITCEGYVQDESGNLGSIITAKMSSPFQVVVSGYHLTVENLPETGDLNRVLYEQVQGIINQYQEIVERTLAAAESAEEAADKATEATEAAWEAIDYINSLGKPLALKGVVDTYSELPESARAGDVWIVRDEDAEYVWLQGDDEGRWEELGPTVDLGPVEEAAKKAQETADAAISRLDDIGDPLTAEEIHAIWED